MGSANGSNGNGRGARYKMGSVVAMTGFKPELLRAWQRRHGLLEPQRTEGGHRLYTEDDVLVLMEMRRLLDEGRSIGEIAARGRNTLLARARLGQAPTKSAKAIRAQRFSDLESCRSDLVRAALLIDQQLARLTLDRAFSIADPEVVLDSVLLPASRSIGEAWIAGRVGIAGEHMVASAVRDRMQTLLRDALHVLPEDAPIVLVACFPGERHENAALTQALRLVWAGRRAIYLGGDLPFSELALAIEQREPDAVQLTVATVDVYDEARSELLAFADEWGSQTLIRVGGPGIRADDQALLERGLLGPSLARG